MPVKTLRPSFDAFKRAGWYPASTEIYKAYMQHLDKQTHGSMKLGDDGLLPSVRNFKNFVDDTPTVYQEFVRMFQGIAKSESVSIQTSSPSSNF